MNETGGFRGHLPRRFVVHHDGIQRCLLEDYVKGGIRERELAYVHLVPGHPRTVAVLGTHSADADRGVIYVGDRAVASSVHVPTHTAVSTT